MAKKEGMQTVGQPRVNDVFDSVVSGQIIDESDAYGLVEASGSTITELCSVAAKIQMRQLH